MTLVFFFLFLNSKLCCLKYIYIFCELNGGGRNRIGRREKWPEKSWEEGEIGGKSREEGDLLPCPPPPPL